MKVSNYLVNFLEIIYNLILKFIAFLYVNFCFQFDVQAKYAFGYKIKDNKMGNHFGHEERREGKSAKGSYHVLLPDGRLQTVSYYVDDDGYHAEVSYH